ncbi:MAG: winged helix-turn-helix transcriptional regulator [Candidatus Micrarchaeota archaeon]
MLDTIDEKIISELDNNARQSNSQIARRTGVPKSVVGYRIRRLEKSGVIKYYYAVIDSYRLGYSSYRIYLKLRHASPKKEREIIDYLAALKQTRWVGLIKGTYNIGVVFLVRTQKEFVEQYNAFIAIYRPYISKSHVGISSGLERYRLPFAKRHLKNRANVDEVHVGEAAEIDATDSRLLQLLSANARMPLLEMAKSLGLTPAGVQYRLRQLMKDRIVLGFRPMLDMEMLGYTLYKIDFNLKDAAGYEKMRRFAKEHEDIFCLVKTIGWADVEFEVYARNTPQFYSILDEIRLKFDDIMSDYDFFMYAELIKFRYTPAGPGAGKSRQPQPGIRYR